MDLLASKVFKKWVVPPLFTTTVLLIMFFIGVIGKIGLIEDYGDVGIAFLATLSAGIILGLIYPLIRMPFRKLGSIGDILTGIFLLNIYFLGFMLADNFDWEEYRFKDLEFLLFMQGFATVGGIILGWNSFFTGIEQLGDSRIEYFKNRLQYPLIIDGGLSNVLEAQGFDLTHKLWSAKLLKSNPEAIIKAHLTYLEAGAQCIITSSYQASIQGFLEVGYDKVTAENLLIDTVSLAEDALEQYLNTTENDFVPLIAASIGPYGAYLADGSEYRGNYGVSEDTLKTFHSERINLLDKTSADLFACETIPSFQEAKILSQLLKETSKPAWVSFSCKDGQHINDGTKMEDCVSLFHQHPNVFAIGVNCTETKFIASLVKIIKSKAGTKKVVVYPNAGTVYDATSKTWSGTSSPDAFVAMTKEWLNLGVDIIGGCCQIGPIHIKHMQDKLKS